MIIIVDYGMGNIGSIVNMMKKVGSRAIPSSDKDTILQATKLILPGVGAFDQGMGSLERLGLLPVLQQKVVGDRTPVIGICLGMQLMTRSSEEGRFAGLGWIDARTVRFKHDTAAGLKVPHMGWNVIRQQKESALLKDMYEEPRFYFVHSYHAQCDHDEDVLALTPYGYDFVSAFQRDNVIGVQFHPEKSHKFGMRLLQNFAKL